MATKIKYMGSADVRVIQKGDTFGDRVPDGIPVTLTWSAQNSWIVDLDEYDITPEIKALVAAEPNFLNVTGLSVVPVNEAQKFLGLTDAPAVESDPIPSGHVGAEVPPAPDSPRLAEDDQQGTPAEAAIEPTPQPTQTDSKKKS